GSSTGWTSGTRWPPCATWTPARRTARRCWASAWWPGTTAPWTSGACSTTPARTAWRRSPRAASTTRAASSASTTAGASTAAAPASSSHRPPPSAHLSVTIDPFSFFLLRSITKPKPKPKCSFSELRVQVHKNSKACVASYPSVVQNNILWFYPRADEEHQDILQRKRPPFIPEIDDPSFVTVYGVRDLPYGWVHILNLDLHICGRLPPSIAQSHSHSSVGLQLRCAGGEPHGPCPRPLRAQGADGQASQEGRPRKISPPALT
uniref:Uncharacterized protein n=2 Tax=Aegilops tauschii subsp. strangulata TaxID=200361 RepID=A0A453M5T8_AEGTS